MNTKQFTAEVKLYHYYTTRDNQHPVKLQVIYDRKVKWYPIFIDGNKVCLSVDEFNKLALKKGNGNLRLMNQTFRATEVKAREVFSKLTSNGKIFSFEKFESEFLDGYSDKGFIAYAEEYVYKFREGSPGTFHTYSSPLNAFKKFRNNKDFNPAELDATMLRGFEGYLMNEKITVTATGKKVIHKASRTTLSIYFRFLRAVYHYVIGSRPELKEFYPFTAKANDPTKFKIRTGSGKKGDALTLDQLRKFIALEVVKGSPEWRAKNLWLFSFFCNGMNFNDIARLKYSAISDSSIKYIRHKTRNTEQSEEVMEIPVENCIKEIIDELGAKPILSDCYVFDVLKSDQSAFEQRRVIAQKLKTVNKWLKRICRDNDLPPITTYWARHSYASTLKVIGTPLELIRELMGHSDLKTTEVYLKNFDFPRRKEANMNAFAQLLTHQD